AYRRNTPGSAKGHPAGAMETTRDRSGPVTTSSLNCRSNQPTIEPPLTPGGDRMEDYELQEVEFWRKLEEESLSRSAMLRRSAAAAVGLTVLSSPAAAWAARAGSDEAMSADGSPLKLIKAAKTEGYRHVVALD